MIPKSETLIIGQDESTTSTSRSVIDHYDDDQNQDSSLTPEFIHPTPVKKKKKNVDNQEDNMLNKAFDVLSSSAAAAITDDDESRSYGNYIGNKLRQYSAKTRSAVQRAISDIIFRADQGMFKENFFRNQNMYHASPYLPQQLSTPVFTTPLHSPSSGFSGLSSEPTQSTNNTQYTNYNTPTESTSTSNLSSIYPNISPMPDHIQNEFGNFNI